MLSPAQLSQAEPRYPLSLVFCEACSLLQISETVPPEQLYCEDYPYFSSISSELQVHSRQNVLELIDSRSLDARSQVIEIASNDGYLLRHYRAQGINVLGIDPADGPARVASEIGIKTINAFFNLDVARDLIADDIQADVIHANNVLAHVPALNDFVKGMHCLLKDDGIAVIEVPTIKPLVEQCAFDTIYHEHLCYFSIKALETLFRRHGLYICDIRSLPIHGGSVRVYLSKKQSSCHALTRMIADEQKAGLHHVGGYSRFSERVWELKDELLSLLTGLREQGKTIAAYGAAAKGSTLLNTMGIGRDLVDYVVDKNSFKQGRFMPGMHLPILPTEALTERMPDYLLLLAWNFCDEIRAQQRDYERGGGRFIVPVPKPRILDPIHDE